LNWATHGHGGVKPLGSSSSSSAGSTAPTLTSYGGPSGITS